jgi:hypothetical protein
MKIQSFIGIRNREPARSIPDNALTAAVDIDLTDAGVIQRRPGYALAKSLANITSAYTTLAGDTYLVAAGVLYRVLPDLTTRALGSSTASQFTDHGRVLFCNDGIKVEDDVVTNIKLPSPPFAPELTVIAGYLPAGTYSACYCFRSTSGIESGTSPIVTVELGEDSGLRFETVTSPAGYTVTEYLTDANGSVFYDNNGAQLNPVQVLAKSLPDNIEQIAYHDTRLYVSRSLANGSSQLLFSKAFHPHLYDLEKDYLLISGVILALASTPQALIIGTESAIFAWDGETLTQLASYGVVRGKSMARTVDGKIYIHTLRGECKALPFENLTERKCTLAPGSQCSTALVNSGGISRFVVINDNLGTAYNARS